MAKDKIWEKPSRFRVGNDLYLASKIIKVFAEHLSHHIRPHFSLVKTVQYHRQQQGRAPTVQSMLPDSCGDLILKEEHLKKIRRKRKN